jgi:hypothetical protein
MSWQEDKLAVSSAIIDDIYHHLDYKMGNRAEDLDVNNEYAKGGEAGFNDAGTSMVLYHEKEGNWMTPKGQVYLYLYDVENGGSKLSNGQFDWVFYPLTSRMMAFQSGYIPPLKKIWTKKFQKEHKGSENLLGVIKAYLIEENGKKELYIDLMSVNPTKKKKGIMSYMIQELRDNFNLTQDQVTFSELTKDGEKFVAKKTYANGGGVGDCIDYIQNSESIKNNGYYLHIENMNNYVGSDSVNIPKINSLCLITFNSVNQKNLKAVDTINSTLLASEIAKLLNIDIEMARIIVYEQITHSKPFTMDMLDDIKNKNIIIADRDTIVCTNISMQYAKGGDFDEIKIGDTIDARWHNRMQWTSGIFKGETENGFEVYDLSIERPEYIEYYAEISKDGYGGSKIFESKKFKDRNYKNNHFNRDKNEYAHGGDVPNEDKMFQLPLEMVVYVPSTQDVDKVISVDKMDKRVDEVKEYLANKFGGYTSADKLGGFVDSKGNLVNEDVVQVTSFGTKEAYDEHKEALIKQLAKWGKKWGQEAIGFEFEGDLLYVPKELTK